MQTEDIVIIILFTALCSLSFLYFQSLQKLRNVSKTVVDLFFKNSILEQKVESFDAAATYDIHQENFIKFLSDSRDWAFDYIDNSQKQIKEFVDIADKEFAFFDVYGSLSEGHLYQDTMQTISSEYKKLKNLLPKETNDRR
jgi:hypothetical protein